jgi:hypothetical protein
MKTFFIIIKRLWMRFASALGWLNTRIVLTLAYVLIIGTAGLFMKIIGRDLLDRRLRRGAEKTYWKEKPPIDTSFEGSQHQF